MVVSEHNPDLRVLGLGLRVFGLHARVSGLGWLKVLHISTLRAVPESFGGDHGSLRRGIGVGIRGSLEYIDPLNKGPL